MPIDLNKLHESAVKNVLYFIELLKEDLIHSNDSKRELGSLDDLYDELESLHYDISRGVYNNVINRFEEIFSIAEGYNVSWNFHKERLMKYINILNVHDISEIDGKIEDMT
jgi:hypothetical protein